MSTETSGGDNGFGIAGMIPEKGAPPLPVPRVIVSVVLILAVPTAFGALSSYQTGSWTGAETLAVFVAALSIHALGAATYLVYGRTDDYAILWKVLSNHLAIHANQRPGFEAGGLAIIFDESSKLQEDEPTASAGIAIDVGWFLVGVLLGPLLNGVLR